MKYGERRSQSYSREYAWLGPYRMQNKQGWLYPYIAGGFNYSDPVWYVNGPKVGIKLSIFCAEVIIICICSAHSVPEYSPPPPPHS